MRHRKNSKRLSRQSAHRKAVLKNIVKSFIEQERITTTLTLAKESRRIAEKLITLAKRNNPGARRQAFRVLCDRDLVKILFTDLAPRFNSRLGGYTRIVHLGQRLGDNAKLAILELTELKKEEKKPKTQKKTKKEAKNKEEVKERPQIAEAQVVKEKEAPKVKKQEIPPKSEQTDKTTKADKKEDQKGFLGGLRKFLKKQDKVE